MKINLNDYLQVCICTLCRLHHRESPPQSPRLQSACFRRRCPHRCRRQHTATVALHCHCYRCQSPLPPQRALFAQQRWQQWQRKQRRQRSGGGSGGGSDGSGSRQQRSQCQRSCGSAAAAATAAEQQRQRRQWQHSGGSAAQWRQRSGVSGAAAALTAAAQRRQRRQWQRSGRRRQ